MTAAPKAISHGDGAAAGALAALTGMSAANAGAADIASAATTDNTTLFIGLPLYGSIEFQPLPVRLFCAQTNFPTPALAAIDPARNRTFTRANFTRGSAYRQDENCGNCCLFR